MSITAKYARVIALGQSMGMKDQQALEAGGRLLMKGTVEYQLQKDLLWDAIKEQAGWELEIAADIRVENTDIYGIWEVKPGDSLSKIANVSYGDPTHYRQIFEANRNILKDPDTIHPGQKLVIPLK